MLYWVYDPKPGPGAFSPHLETKMGEFADGTATTILAAEVTTGDGDGSIYRPGEPVRDVIVPRAAIRGAIRTCRKRPSHAWGQQCAVQTLAIT